MSELLQEIEARERASAVSGAGSSHPKRGGGRTPPTAATLLTGDSPRCCFCGQGYLAEYCDRVGTSSQADVLCA